MKKVKSKLTGLKVLNDRVLIKPDKVEVQGASVDVKSAIESGKLILPDAYEAFYKNLPDSGVIVGLGEKARKDLIIGSHVHFAKMAVAKISINGDNLLVARDYDVDFV